MRNIHAGSRSAVYRFSLHEGIIGGLRGMMLQEQSSQFLVLLAAFTAQFAQWRECSSFEVAIGSLIERSRKAGEEGVTNHCAHLLFCQEEEPHRVQTVRQLLHALRKHALVAVTQEDREAIFRLIYSQDGRGLSCALEFLPRLIDMETARRFADDFQSRLIALLRDPDHVICDPNLLLPTLVLIRGCTASGEGNLDHHKGGERNL